MRKKSKKWAQKFRRSQQFKRDVNHFRRVWLAAFEGTKA